MYKELSKEQERQLLAKFNSLESIKEKFMFWNKSLKQDYIQFLFLNFHNKEPRMENGEVDMVYGLQPFIIYPKPNEFEDFCNFFTKQYNKDIDKRKKQIDFIEFSELSKKFISSIENYKDKTAAIASEIKKVNRLIDEKRHFDRINFNDKSANYFIVGYEQEYLERPKLNMSFLANQYFNLISYLNGKAYGEFNLFLTQRLSEEEGKSKKTSKKENEEGLTKNQRLIVLHYLGALSIIRKAENATKQAVFLEQVICKSGENIRKEFSSIGNLIKSKDPKQHNTNKADLKAVLAAFKELGLNEMEKAIEADLSNF